MLRGNMILARQSLQQAQVVLDGLNLQDPEVDRDTCVIADTVDLIIQLRMSLAVKPRP
jgi:hypothetical protein